MVITRRLILQVTLIRSEEVIYSQGSPKRGETFRDFDWEKNRFVEIAITDHLSVKEKKLNYTL